MAPATPLNDYVPFITEKIRYIIESFGPRDPGSVGENAAQTWLQEELSQYCDAPATRESFTVHPKSFMAFVPIACAFFLIAVAAYWLPGPWGLLLPWLAISVALGIVSLQFVFYKRLLDPLFPKRNSANVYGARAPKGALKRRVILSGHCDAAYEWRYHAISPLLFKGIIAAGLGSILFILAANLLSLLLHLNGNENYNTLLSGLGVVQVVLIPVLLLLARFTNFNQVSPGANDNLTGVLTTLAIAKYMQETKTRLEHTEIVFFLAGSEEAGLRGTKAYVEKHQDELQAVPTFFLGLETFRDLDHLAICHRDLNALVKHDPRACALVKEAGKKFDQDVPYQAIFAGASDAASFSQAGIPATTLEAMDPAPAPYYHTRHDTWENLNPHCIEVALKIAWESVLRYDAHGLEEA